MVYVIGAVAACLGVGIGIIIGFVLAVGREARVPLEELIRMEDEARQLEAEMQSSPNAATEVQLSAMRKRLRQEARKAVATEAHMARVSRIRARAKLLWKWL